MFFARPAAPGVRRAFALVAAVCAASTVAACSSGKAKGDAASPTGASATGSSGTASAAASPANASIKGQRFKLLVASTATTNKVVEDHAIQIMKQDGVNASIEFSGASSNVQVAQLINGQVDAYAEAVTGALSAIGQGIPLVDFGLLQPRQDYVFIARPNVKTLADIKGKKVGVLDTTGVNWAQALIVLQSAGLTANQVSIVQAGGQSARLAALISGRIDATMLSHSAQLQLASKGYNVLYDYTKQSSNLYDDNAFALKNWLASHQALAVEFNKAILESYTWFNDTKNSDAVLQEALSIAPASDKAQTQQLFDELRQGNAYPAGTILDASVLDQEQTLFKQAKAITDTVPTSQWVDTSYAQQAKAALGTS